MKKLKQQLKKVRRDLKKLKIKSYDLRYKELQILHAIDSKKNKQ